MKILNKHAYTYVLIQTNTNTQPQIAKSKGDAKCIYDKCTMFLFIDGDNHKFRINTKGTKRKSNMFQA